MVYGQSILIRVYDIDGPLATILLDLMDMAEGHVGDSAATREMKFKKDKFVVFDQGLLPIIASMAEFTAETIDQEEIKYMPVKQALFTAEYARGLALLLKLFGSKQGIRKEWLEFGLSTQSK